MNVPELDIDLLTRFEQELDAACPEKGKIQAKVLGYGEISTVLEIRPSGQPGVALKRLPMFVSQEEAIRHEALVVEYVDVLQHQVCVHVAPTATARIINQRTGRVVLYVAQERLPSESIAHRAIHSLPARDVELLIRAVLKECGKVFGFNAANHDELEVGLDGQISNWSILQHETVLAGGEVPIALTYLDVTSPFLRRNGQEQLDPELFLRSAPSFLVWLLKLLFLEEVMTRYYDPRRVAVDIVANLIKEQRAELVPRMVEVVNETLGSSLGDAGYEPLTVKEVRDYYREDAWIWRSYLAARHADRAIHRLTRRAYPYILPDRIKR